MVLLASAFDQSKHLGADDLKSGEKKVRIKSITAEAVNDRGQSVQKLVVYFSNTDKGLILNKTNNRTIRSAYGDDTAGWIGKALVLFATQVDYAGRSVAGLRVRIPPPKQQTVLPVQAPVQAPPAPVQTAPHVPPAPVYASVQTAPQVPPAPVYAPVQTAPQVPPAPVYAPVQASSCTFVDNDDDFDDEIPL
jgi:hypothetical protein